MSDMAEKLLTGMLQYGKILDYLDSCLFHWGHVLGKPVFVLLLWIFYVFVLSCVCYVFVCVCLYALCGHLLGKG